MLRCVDVSLESRICACETSCQRYVPCAEYNANEVEQ